MEDKRKFTPVGIALGVALLVILILAIVLFNVLAPTTVSPPDGDEDEPPIVFEPKKGGVDVDPMVWYLCDKKVKKKYECVRPLREIKNRYNFFFGSDEGKLLPAFIGGTSGGEIVATVKRTETSADERIDFACIKGSYGEDEVSIEIDFTQKTADADLKDNYIGWKVDWDGDKREVKKRNRKARRGDVPFIFAIFDSDHLYSGPCGDGMVPAYSLKFEVNK